MSVLYFLSKISNENGNTKAGEHVIDGWHTWYLTIDKRISSVAVIGANGGNTLSVKKSAKSD